MGANRESDFDGSLEPKGPYRERYLVALKPDRRFAFFKDASKTKKEKPQ